MTQADYSQGRPVRQAPAAAVPMDHPTRDLIVGAVVGAAALWAVPKMLDAIADRFGWGFGLEPEDDDSAAELEP
jgi:hypothetical protein